jgi:hypothetical protein
MAITARWYDGLDRVIKTELPSRGEAVVELIRIHYPN